MGPALDSPRVTVVVPTYRRPLLLVEALGSILAGSYSDFEVLVVNDGAGAATQATVNTAPQTAGF